GTVFIGAADPSSLSTVNLTTGETTLVCNFVGFTFVDFAIDYNGVIIGHDITNNALYIINKTTCETTHWVDVGYDTNYAQGMDFDWSTNILYAGIMQASVVPALVSWDMNGTRTVLCD